MQFEAFGYQFLTTTVKNREGQGSIDVYWNSANGWSFLCESPLFTPDDDTSSQNEQPPGWAVTKDIFSRFYFSGGIANTFGSYQEDIYILASGEHGSEVRLGSGATAKQIGGSSVVLSSDTIRTTLEDVNQSLLGSSAADNETFGLIEGVSLNGSALAAFFEFHSIPVSTATGRWGSLSVETMRRPLVILARPIGYWIDPSYPRCLGVFKCKSTRISDLL